MTSKATMMRISDLRDQILVMLVLASAIVLRATQFGCGETALGISNPPAAMPAQHSCSKRTNELNDSGVNASAVPFDQDRKVLEECRE